MDIKLVLCNVVFLFVKFQLPAANVIIYPATNGIDVNQKFSVFVIQNGNRQSTPVYMSSSQHRVHESPSVHGGRTMSWTSFAFTGQGVTVEVHTPRDFQNCIVRPKSYGYNCHRTGNKVAQFDVTDVNKMMSVELDYDYGSHNGGPDITDKLMVFADPPEKDVPNQHDSHVLYYGPGVHDLNGQKTLDPAITEVYLAPGAWVKGGFKTSANHGVKIHGRGVVDNSPYPWHDPRFEWATILMDKGRDHTIEGLVVSDSMQFFLRALGQNNTFRNVKTVGAWIFNNDGVSVGTDGQVVDSFIHANDDSIKLYESRIQVHRCVVWQAQNGAVFQTGWWSARDMHDVLVTDVDVIHTDWCTFKGPTCHISDNDAVLDNAGNTQTISISNMVFRNIRVEGLCPRIIFWRMHSGAHGTATNVQLSNWSVESQLTNDSLHSELAGTGSTGHVTNWEFINFRVGGQCVDNAAHYDIIIDQQNTNGIQFTCHGAPVG